MLYRDETPPDFFLGCHSSCFVRISNIAQSTSIRCSRIPSPFTGTKGSLSAISSVTESKGASLVAMRIPTLQSNICLQNHNRLVGVAKKANPTEPQQSSCSYWIPPLKSWGLLDCWVLGAGVSRRRTYTRTRKGEVLWSIMVLQNLYSST
jgi:hypothetical protein